MERNTGPTRVTAAPIGGAGGGGGRGEGNGDDELFRAVREASAGEYEILGELGRDTSGSVIYLAREHRSTRLVALRLDREGDEYVLDVARTLEKGLAPGGITCGRCGASLAAWARFCPHCGADVARQLASEAAATRDEVLAAVRDAASAEYEILGEMERADGGGTVFFARELSSGKLVTLRLRPDGQGGGDAEAYTLGVTQVLKPLVASLDATAGKAAPAPATAPAGVAPAPVAAAPSPPSVAPAPEPMIATATGASPLIAQPLARRATPQEVLVPHEQAPPDEVLPKRPPEGLPPWVIAVGATVFVGLAALAVFVRVHFNTPDATQSSVVAAVSSPSTPSAVGPAPPARPAMRPTAPAAVDSGHLQIVATLPRGASVTVNDVPLRVTSATLSPGNYTLHISAPGYSPITEHVQLAPGQTLAWSPVMAPTRAEVRTPATREAPHRTTDVARASAKAKAAPVAAPVAAPLSRVTCASAFEAKDWTSAATACARDAQAGDVTAERNLGVMLLQGYGTTPDLSRAAMWLRKAADGGSRDAAYQLAQMYETGRGVTKDPAQAFTWYRKAAQMGDVDSQVKVGKAYESGSGVERDYAQAIQWYRKAADQGSGWAQNRIGWLYGMGRGVARDDAEAVAWFRRAAMQGEPQGEYNLGFMYANGRGVAQSDSAAVDWFRKAAKQGYADAIRELRNRGLTP